MSNAVRGKVIMTLGDAEYPLRLTASRIAEIEGVLKRPFGVVVTEMGSGSVECTAAVAAKAMELPIKAVLALMDEFTVEPIALACVEAINASGVFPNTEGQAKANPPKATA